ncbi:hypothetical protein BESB_003410 [Besnoitia besnoiti]|uniref:RAP domain-containing protein n=1 Tax=Besnoitia besnoiti TaxID=94643 RepID=A0A2A9MQ06_BESBE|nr:hypothetical protein BESB_003410 [Besnoitia besnoiti]PFH38000.1 hypothetical protein BESB_003410 [Besnoitia besnoiti]
MRRKLLPFLRREERRSQTLEAAAARAVCPRCRTAACSSRGPRRPPQARFCPSLSPPLASPAACSPPSLLPSPLCASILLSQPASSPSRAPRRLASSGRRDSQARACASTQSEQRLASGALASPAPTDPLSPLCAPLDARPSPRSSSCASASSAAAALPSSRAPASSPAESSLGGAPVVFPFALCALSPIRLASRRAREAARREFDSLMQPRHPLVKAVQQSDTPRLPHYLKEFSLKQKDARDMWKAKAAASSPVHQAHAAASQAGKRAPRTSPTAIHPAHMDPPLVASTAAELARTRSGNDAMWAALIRRALQLRPLFEPKEIAILLNALSRTRRFPPELFQSFAPLIAQKLVYFNSSHLCMVLSAYAKSRVQPGSEFLAAVRQQLLHRLALREIQSPVELAMLVNALVKLKLCENRSLVERLAQHLRQRLAVEDFHVRELAVLASAFAAVDYANLALFSHIADAAVETVNEATPVELARLIHAFSSCSTSSAAAAFGGEGDAEAQEQLAQREQSRKKLEALLEVCVACAREKIAFMSPDELVLSANAVGQAYSVISSPALRLDVAALLANVRSLAVASLSLFTLSQISSLLFSFSRWRQPFPPADLLRVIDRLEALSALGTSAAIPAYSGFAVPGEREEEGDAASALAPTQISILYFLSVLLSSAPLAGASSATAASALKREEALRGARWLMNKWRPDFFAALASPAFTAAPAACAEEDARGAQSASTTPSSCKELDKTKRRAPPAVQHLLRLLEAFVALRDPEDQEEEQRFLRGLQGILPRIHFAIDSATASQFVLLLEVLRLPEEDDLVLVMKEKKKAL